MAQRHDALGTAWEWTEMTHLAACPCGQLQLACRGDPVRVSVCHCLDCQRRSGSAFAVQARFAPEMVTVSGICRERTRLSDTGNAAVFHFCPDCGTTIWYHAMPDHTLFAVPVGLFADPAFPGPSYSVYEDRKHGWIEIVGDSIEHYA